MVTRKDSFSCQDDGSLRINSYVQATRPGQSQQSLQDGLRPCDETNMGSLWPTKAGLPAYPGQTPGGVKTRDKQCTVSSPAYWRPQSHRLLCLGLKVWFLPKPLGWSRNPQGDGVWGGALGGSQVLMRLWVGGCDGLSVLRRRGRDARDLEGCTPGKGHRTHSKKMLSASQGEGSPLPTHWTCWQLDRGLSSLQNRQN